MAKIPKSFGQTKTTARKGYWERGLTLGAILEFSEGGQLGSRLG